MSFHEIRAIMKALPEAMIAAEDTGSILFSNRKAKELFGYRKSEMAEKSISQLLSRPDKDCSCFALHKNGTRIAISFISHINEVASQTVRVFTLYKKDGPEEKSPAQHTWMSISPFLFILQNATTNEVLKVSERSQSLLGYEPHEMEGTSFLDSVLPNDQPHVKQILDSIVSMYPAPFRSLLRVRRIRKNGEICMMELSIKCIEHAGTRYLTSVGRDITEHTKLEQKRIHQATSTISAENIGALKIASMTIHEFRGPLMGLLYETEALGDLATTEEEKQCVTSAIQSSQQANTVLNNFLTLSQMQAGRYDISIVPFNLPQIIKLVSMQFQKQATLSQVTLSSTVDPTIPHALLGDARKLHHIFELLLQTSLSVAKKGSSLHISVVPRAPILQNYLIQITTIAPQLSEQQQAFVEHLNYHTEPFLLLEDPVISGQFCAAGLHLIAAKSIVQKLHGAMRIYTDNLSSKIIYQIVLPLAESQAQNILPEPLLEENVEGCLKAYKPHVLCVDDNVMNVLILKQLWKQLGCAECETATSGEMALECVKKKKYDLISIDYFMPGMNGQETIQNIRLLEQNQNHRSSIILCSGLDPQEHEGAFKQTLADDFLIKPISKQPLAQTALRLLARRQPNKGV